MKTSSDIIYPTDAAGAACEMQQLIPKPELVPLSLATLQLEHNELKMKFEKLINFLAEKGLDYE